MIAFGSFGNFAVVSSFIRQPALRTQRNFFILNLAISDLVLCLVTMPLTLLDIVNKHWPLGDSELSCKVAGGLQAVSVFVSTISITVIALDRYQLIVYPTRDILKRIGGAAALFFMWLLGFLLALPMFMVRTLERQQLSPSKGASQKDTGGVYSIDYWYRIVAYIWYIINEILGERCVFGNITVIWNREDMAGKIDAIEIFY